VRNGEERTTKVPRIGEERTRELQRNAERRTAEEGMTGEARPDIVAERPEVAAAEVKIRARR
jgi:hypothetical protein